jgi:hypothetical protein
MHNELVKASPVNVLAPGANQELPSLVERAGGAARFAWEEFFFAKHHNPLAERAYGSAARRFLAWCDEEGLELASISPGMVGKYEHIGSCANHGLCDRRPRQGRAGRVVGRVDGDHDRGSAQDLGGSGE